MGDNVYVDPPALTRVGRDLDEAGDTLDALAAGAPDSDNYGIAGALVTSMLSGILKSAAMVSADASIIGQTVVDCAKVNDATDQEAAESFILSGDRDE